MTQRIKQSDLEKRVEHLNQMLGLPNDTYKRDSDGNYVRDERGLVANPNVFYIGMAYGGYRLEQMCEGGGARDVSFRGTKQEIWDFIGAYMQGIKVGKDAA